MWASTWGFAGSPSIRRWLTPLGRRYGPNPYHLSVSIPCQGGTDTVRAPGDPPRTTSRSSTSFDGSASKSAPVGLARTSIQYDPLARVVMSKDCPGTHWKYVSPQPVGRT